MKRCRPFAYFLLRHGFPNSIVHEFIPMLLHFVLRQVSRSIWH